MSRDLWIPASTERDLIREKKRVYRLTEVLLARSPQAHGGATPPTRGSGGSRKESTERRRKRKAERAARRAGRR